MRPSVLPAAFLTQFPACGSGRVPFGDARARGCADAESDLAIPKRFADACLRNQPNRGIAPDRCRLRLRPLLCPLRGATVRPASWKMSPEIRRRGSRRAPSRAGRRALRMVSGAPAAESRWRAKTFPFEPPAVRFARRAAGRSFEIRVRDRRDADSNACELRGDGWARRADRRAFGKREIRSGPAAHGAWRGTCRRRRNRTPASVGSAERLGAAGSRRTGGGAGGGPVDGRARAFGLGDARGRS